MNQADTAWMLISTALVLLMTPALGFFYGGLVRSKNALNTMMMSFIALGFIGVVWATVGYSLAFTTGNNWLGDTSRILLRGVGVEPQGTIPHYLFMCYQGTFAIITAALISGAIVERMRFSAYLLFIALWSLVVYAPVAHWVWGGGWIADLGALDFAGGTVVPMGTLVVWTMLDYLRSGKPTAVGAATAIVVGLVAITPAAGFIGPMSALALGAIAALPSYYGLLWRAKTSLDDSLDVVAAHGLGGTVGALLTGVFAQKALNGVADGLLFGNPSQLGIQAVAVVATIVYGAVATFLLLKLVGLVVPLRATADDQSVGLDMCMHGEEAYVHAEG